MKLKSVRHSENSPSVWMEFDQNGRAIVKFCQISACAKAVVADKAQLKEAAKYTLMRAIREAERDFAYMENSADLRENGGSFFAGPLSEDESRLINEAVDFLLL